MEKQPLASGQGTTLEVLALYFPYGISIYWGLSKSTHLLTGLVADSNSMYLDGQYTAFVENCRPILRPFSALCEPLEDGTVPAVTLAKHFLFGEITEATVRHGVSAVCNGARLSPYRAPSELGDAPTHQEGIMVTGWLKNGLRSEKFAIAIGQDGVMSNGFHTFSIADWLRANHYALPVNGRPLIEGIDYIPKASATPPATEKGDSRS